jgi:uncharacterized protein (DUF2336 family)
MDEFPFSEEDWELVKEASWFIANAGAIEDEVLVAAGHAEMEQVLSGLTAKYGEHPILIETAADFEVETQDRIDLYERAAALAEQHGLPTYTIVLSLAQVLIEDRAQLAAAHARLLACQAEVAELGDEYEQREWQELINKCAPQPPDEQA